MKILVLVKHVPDTYGERQLTPSGMIDRSDAIVIDEVSERALEVALRTRDQDKQTQIVVLSMGPAAVTATLRKALSLGADSAVHVLDDALSGADLSRTAQVLAAAIRLEPWDLILCGNESSDGGSGVLPAMLAEHLSVPGVTALDTVEIVGGDVRGLRVTENGSAVIRAALPAIVSVTERSPEARFPNFRGILSAKKKPIRTVSLHDLQLDPETVSRGGGSVIVQTTKRPARTAGVQIVDDGSAVEQLVEFLAARRLI